MGIFWTNRVKRRDLLPQIGLQHEMACCVLFSRNFCFECGWVQWEQGWSCAQLGTSGTQQDQFAITGRAIHKIGKLSNSCKGFHWNFVSASFQCGQAVVQHEGARLFWRPSLNQILKKLWECERKQESASSIGNSLACGTHH